MSLNEEDDKRVERLKNHPNVYIISNMYHQQDACGKTTKDNNCMKFKNKLITGTPINNTFLRNEWEVDLNDYYTLEEALEDLYTQVCDSAHAMNGRRRFI